MKPLLRTLVCLILIYSPMSNMQAAWSHQYKQIAHHIKLTDENLTPIVPQKKQKNSSTKAAKKSFKKTKSAALPPVLKGLLCFLLSLVPFLGPALVLRCYDQLDWEIDNIIFWLAIIFFPITMLISWLVILIG